MPKIEMLTAEQVEKHWDQLGPIMESGCQANEVAVLEINSKDILELAKTGMCAVFVMWEEDSIECAVALQFGYVMDHKYAEVVSFGGRRMMLAKSLAWQPILDWLRANEVEFLDAQTHPRLAAILMSKFGFTESSVNIRMRL